jgi:cytoplasmic iron level regulating protein YaaA (DUF328/UPF0246 family)
MYLLLPPSEGKNQPEPGDRFDLSHLSFCEELTPVRSMVLRQHKEIDQRAIAPAHQLYAGVLYQALDYSTLSAASKTFANSNTIIISAAFGLLRLKDEIPYYKFKIESALWRGDIARALKGYDDELIIDARSSTYASAWRPNPLNTVGIRVFNKVNGDLKVITHMSKKTRGEVARYLYEKEISPRTPRELHQQLNKKFSCRLVTPEGKQSWFIDVIA